MSAETTSAGAATRVEPRADRARFCSRCGAVSEIAEPQGPEPGLGRVCGECGMGVLLTCAREALPGPGGAFLVVTEDLAISAVSEGAEAMFGSESSIVGSGLLACVSSPLGENAVARYVGGAATGSREVVTVPLYASGPKARRFKRLEGRVATCGPPRAALIVVDAARRRRR
jgi:hypothetical protein